MKDINYNNINKHIAEVFKYHRKKNNYTQEKVAELTGLSPKYISQLERGISGGTLETILKLCNIYNVSPNSILEPFLNSTILQDTTEFVNNYDKLSTRDKNAIKNMLNYFINNK